MNTHPSMASLQQDGRDDRGGGELPARGLTMDDLDLENGVCDLVIGNDIEQLKRELQKNADDSDAESSESGFSEQGDANKDGGASGAADRNASNNNSLISDDREDKGTSHRLLATKLNVDDSVTAL